MKYTQRMKHNFGFILWPFERFIWYMEHILFKIFKRKKEYCILRYLGNGAGFFCYFNTLLGGIAYADRKNMIPIIDMKYIRNTYLTDDKVGRVNAWEYYFEQPVRISVDELLSHERCFIFDQTHYLPGPLQNPNFYSGRGGMLSYWQKIRKKYIRLAPAVINRFENMKIKYKGKKILGVHIRGTDYTVLKPAGHPVQPTPEQAIDKAKEAMQEKNFDILYLSTEDKRIMSKFQKAFGEKLIYPESEYVEFDYTGSNHGYIDSYTIDKDNDKYLRGMEYLVSILFLSQCDGIICSQCGGSTGAFLFSEGFDYLYVFDLGYYD